MISIIKKASQEALSSGMEIAISVWREQRYEAEICDFIYEIEWADVDILSPLEVHDFKENEYDLFHMRVRNEESLETLRRAEKAGIETVNPYDAAYLASDRFSLLKELDDIGVKTPKFDFGRSEEVDLEPPFYVKPRFENSDENVEKSDNGFYKDEKLVEEEIEGDHFIVYFFGEDIRAAEIKDNGSRDEINSDKIPYSLRNIAHEISETGLELFGTEVVLAEDTPYPIDVNCVAGLSGIQEGTERYENLLYEKVK